MKPSASRMEVVHARRRLTRARRAAGLAGRAHVHRVLSHPEVYWLTRCAPPWARPAFMAMSQMGLRVSEVAQASWGRARRGPGPVMVEVRDFKNKSRMMRAVPPELWEEIRHLSPAARQRAFSASAAALARICQTIARDAGLPWVRLHDLRCHWLMNSRATTLPSFGRSRPPTAGRRPRTRPTRLALGPAPRAPRPHRSTTAGPESRPPRGHGGRRAGL